MRSNARLVRETVFYRRSSQAPNKGVHCFLRGQVLSTEHYSARFTNVRARFSVACIAETSGISQCFQFVDETWKAPEDNDTTSDDKSDTNASFESIGLRAAEWLLGWV